MLFSFLNSNRKTTSRKSHRIIILLRVMIAPEAIKWITNLFWRRTFEYRFDFCVSGQLNGSNNEMSDVFLPRFSVGNQLRRSRPFKNKVWTNIYNICCHQHRRINKDPEKKINKKLYDLMDQYFVKGQRVQ